MAIAALLAVAACAGGDDEQYNENGQLVEKTDVRVVGVDLGRAVDVGEHITNETDVFAPGDTIYASVRTTGSSPKTILGVQWKNPDGDEIGGNNLLIRPRGDTSTLFAFRYMANRSTGPYTLDVRVNGKMVKTTRFVVSSTAEPRPVSIVAERPLWSAETPAEHQTRLAAIRLFARKTFARLTGAVASLFDRAPNVQSTGARDLPAAVSAVVRVQMCGSRGAACLDSAVALGNAAGSVMRYFPRGLDSSGGVLSYWVMSRDMTGRPGTPAYLGDQTGQVFEARYDPRWEKTGPDSAAKLLALRSAVKPLRYIRECIKSTYEMYGGGYPVDLSRSERREPEGRCIAFPDRNAGTVDTDEGNRAGAATFVVNYSAGKVDPRRDIPATFSVSMRPVAYGGSSIRSFFADTTGAVHFTSEHRDATIDDPLVFGCEAPEIFYECTIALAESSRAILPGARISP
jgi:hypothetical protein